jgi:hypothetical protein
MHVDPPVYFGPIISCRATLGIATRSIAAVRKSGAGKFALTGGIFAVPERIRAFQNQKS